MTNLITAGEAARLLGVKAGTIRSYARRGYLTAEKHGPRLSLYQRAEVEALRDNMPKRTGAPKRRQP